MSKRKLKHNHKVKIWKRDNWTCQYCGKRVNIETATVDHKTPLCEGGDNLDYNLATSCWDCNHKKAKAEVRIKLLIDEPRCFFCKRLERLCICKD